MAFLCRGVAVLLAAVALVALVSPRNTWFGFDLAIVWPVVLLTLAAVWWAGRAGWGARLATAVSEAPTYAVLIGTAVGGVVTVLHQRLVVVDFGWDALAVYQAARSGVPASIEDLTYFAWYPNNIPLLAVEQLAIRTTSLVGADPLGTVLVLQAGAAVLCIACVGATVGLLGRPGAVWPVQALTTFFIGLNANLGVPYSDIPAAACVAAAAFAATLAWVRGHRWAWGAALVLLCLGVALKAYVVALAFGALAVVLLGWRRWGTAKTLLATAALTLGLGLGVVVIHLTAAQVTGMTADRLAGLGPAIPPEHYLAMGTFDSPDPNPTRSYGGYSPQHVEATLAERDPDRRRAMLRETVAEQVGGRTIPENLRFFGWKIAWFWGDGTFYAHGEGPDNEDPGQLNGVMNDVQQWFIGHGEPYRRYTANVIQGIWVATLLITAVGAWRSPRGMWPPTTTAAATLLTLTGYLTLFEARSRYLLALLPVFLVLTGLVARLHRDDRKHRLPTP